MVSTARFWVSASEFRVQTGQAGADVLHVGCRTWNSHGGMEPCS